MKRIGIMTLVIIGLIAGAQVLQAETGNRLGVGVNYWKMLDDVDDDRFDENGLSWLVTYQHELAALLKLEVDLEVFPDDFLGMNDTAYAPEAYLVLGSAIYAAVGVGILYADGDFADDPFYALRAGLDLEILSDIYLDLNVNYRFAEWTNADDMADDIDGDTLTLGAALRFAF
ncbi:MAG: hypothetical protein A2498_02115 [Lentisphaerae bacterium RIFOXYC12_FULL_60_16]|nr:MAG: hypothetical protein A2498_02115 [Lentisphaerae bacterium RIFOXYC12_FULL_60_16]OGV83940.1 MAG: hypothetical protein A2340_08380 [Lentisphaerae bacterium RIFOXYB12_FULL_60_10]